MGFQISPGVAFSEIDLTTVVPAVATTGGAYAGAFRWGPVSSRTLVDSEDTLVATFGQPDTNTFLHFFTCANFLAYGNNLNVVRTVGAAAKNSTSDGTGQLIKNQDDYTTNWANGQALKGVWAGKYPGTLGNGIVVSIADIGNWGLWPYASSFSAAPGTSSFATGLTALYDELHVIVVDGTGLWTGTPGTVLETFPFASKAADAQSADGTSTYYANVVSRGSKYVWWIDHPTFGSNWGNLASSTTFKTMASSVVFTTVTGGPYVAGEQITAKTGTVTGTSGLVGGTGYSTPPTVTFSGGGATTQATAHATVSTGAVTAVIIDTPGVGYTSEPSIAFGGPGASAAANAVVTYTTVVTKAIVEAYNSGTKTITADMVSGPAFSTLTKVFGGTSNATGIPTTVTNVSQTDTLTGGTDVVPLDGDIIIGYDLFQNGEDIDLSLVMAGANSSTVGIHLINSIAEFRKDCVVFLSPLQTDVVSNAGNEQTAVVATRNLYPSSSYAFMDGNWKYQYDKYNDVFRWVPCNGDVAGLCAQTDETRDPWFSPAGLNRGNLKNVTKLAWNPRRAYRDVLYGAGVNPIVSFPGQGAVLYGDKTMQVKPSAFDRINVRRLFIVLEKAISTAAKFMLFEFNDDFTRAQFVSLVEPFLRDVQGRRGIFDFKVVCDTTNNTGQVIDSNQFVGDIYVKPARSINFIQLNFVAVRTGVDFNEIVGKF